MSTTKYTLKCTEGHPNEVEFNNLIDALEDDRCETCRSQFASSKPDFIPLECPCGYSDSPDVDYAKSILQHGCPNANEDVEAPDNIRFHHLSASGSPQALYYSYRWSVQGHKHKLLMKEDMQDYWEYLIHFTDNEGFLSIMESHTILAHSAGYYYRRDPAGTKAVCLTEAPLDYADRFFDKYGSIGFVFRKAVLQKAGALPVMHLAKGMIKTQERFGGFAKELKPFVQLLRTDSTGGIGKRYDWISDREWRVPAAINLLKTSPIGMVYQEPIAYRSDDDDLWRAKIMATFTFGEIKLD
jgi:hypothetical protein